jgi:two-component system sensor histidine kinase ResE
VIAGYIELMQDELGGALDGRQDEMLQSLGEQTRILQRRVDQMLEMSRMESGRLELALEDVDLHHFMAEVHRQFQPLASARDIRLELVMHDRTPECIQADPDVLRTDIIGNLMSNALAHTPPGGTIRISLQAGDDGVSLEIADTGTGIPQEQIERIFSRYYQSCGANRTGLGLAIARAGVENHGGRIDVQSRVGKGTSFRVRLPLRPATAPVTGPRLLVTA